eukprot:GHVU01200217.1.p2 GENE.GHVU01200217.1~~GHVU01200217.1.p2  ORF type:complete len:107 (+),score=15.87 GHVU01200217.1:29-322(+)
MDYAIISGGDIGPLGALGADELNRLFASSLGEMSENMRNALSTQSFLHHTGTETDRLILCDPDDRREGHLGPGQFAFIKGAAGGSRRGQALGGRVVA